MATRGLILGIAVMMFVQTAGDLNTQGKTAYDHKEYAKSAQLYLQSYKLDPKNRLALYNAACSLALANQVDEAFAALEELSEKGYNQLEQLKGDSDFSGIRADSRWQKIVDKVAKNAKKNPPIKRWVKPYKILPVPGTTGSLASRLGARDAALWLDRDVLSFLHRTSAKTVQLTGGIQEPMKQIPGSDLWIIQLEMKGWDRALITYGFVEDGKFQAQTLWQGPRAPRMPTEAKSLQGKIINKTIHSDALDEDRPVLVYLPPNAPSSNIPAVFLADGGSCETFARILEPLILAGRVRPCAIVGMESGGYRGDRDQPYDETKDFRSREYVPGYDPDRFDRHMKFFTDEVLAFVSKEYGISTQRADLAVTGFSNGGAFSAGAAFRRPEFFGTSMPLSLGVPPVDPRPLQPMPRMFFAAGDLESFVLRTGEVYKKVKGWGLDASFDRYLAGHDFNMWKLAFSRLMPKVFPASTSHQTMDNEGRRHLLPSYTLERGF